MAASALVLGFGSLLVGGILIDNGAKSVSAALQGQSGNPGSTGGGGGASASSTLLNSPAPKGSQKAQVQQVAAEFGLSPNTLWGVYGTESSFGSDPSTSSAGAEGPFQFLPSTFAQYGTGSIQDFTDSLIAAAKYLKSLGATSDPTAPATYQALNNYNGNGGGNSPTSYVASVIKYGGQF